ncbi:uncharacterized protein EI90DRAFT_1966538 [Cantharellus anzutake]|uniref:uncharacterized protein n=1 Tax=Cantharellus anzutake TaxID=1750568 RepID=UPI0019083716|nr:uncharacterized protein EI90DRAFT_1966538 [Cantharellus anzutake]KAF8326218.1 hypothetical protein EI90DRAFT_1966538 [Cantharellus anzutake]
MPLQTSVTRPYVSLSKTSGTRRDGRPPTTIPYGEAPAANYLMYGTEALPLARRNALVETRSSGRHNYVVFFSSVSHVVTSSLHQLHFRLRSGSSVLAIGYKFLHLYRPLLVPRIKDMPSEVFYKYRALSSLSAPALFIWDLRWGRKTNSSAAAFVMPC